MKGNNYKKDSNKKKKKTPKIIDLIMFSVLVFTILFSFALVNGNVFQKVLLIFSLEFAYYLSIFFGYGYKNKGFQLLIYVTRFILLIFSSILVSSVLVGKVENYELDYYMYIFILVNCYSATTICMFKYKVLKNEFRIVMYLILLSLIFTFTSQQNQFIFHDVNDGTENLLNTISSSLNTIWIIIAIDTLFSLITSSLFNYCKEQDFFKTRKVDIATEKPIFSKKYVEESYNINKREKHIEMNKREIEFEIHNLNGEVLQKQLLDIKRSAIELLQENLINDQQFKDFELAFEQVLKENNILI